MAPASSIKKRAPASPSLQQQPPPRHFFKVILKPIDHQGIRLPTVFLRRYGDTLVDECAVLEVDGEEWEVELVRDNGETWLQKGLAEFGEYYSIDEGYFLVFKYLGNSRFRVRIYSTSAGEIVCPIRSTHQSECQEDNVLSFEEEDEEEIDDWDDGDSVEILEDLSGKKRENVLNVVNSGKLSCTLVNGRRLRRRADDNGEDGSSRGTSESFSAKEKLETYLREFESDHPYFGCILPRSSVLSPRSLAIPLAFGMKNFGGSGRCRIGYKVRLAHDRKTWPLSVLVYKGGRGRISGDGWKRFLEENEITVGEICIFELEQSNKVFNFHRRS